MGVAKLQTVEDGPPRSPARFTDHFAETANEYLRVEMSVRQRQVEPMSLVIRYWKQTGRTTVALETIRVE